MKLVREEEMKRKTWKNSWKNYFSEEKFAANKVSFRKTKSRAEVGLTKRENSQFIYDFIKCCLVFFE